MINSKDLYTLLSNINGKDSERIFYTDEVATAIETFMRNTFSHNTPGKDKAYLEMQPLLRTVEETAFTIGMKTAIQAMTRLIREGVI
ncbi:MAG: hypothetical protein GX786_04785 [Clostridiales bacterium]|nr:hypothetical protein [Clostridiales bacterium]